MRYHSARAALSPLLLKKTPPIPVTFAIVASYFLLGSYRMATTPEPSSTRPASFRSRGFDSPANSVGP